MAKFQLQLLEIPEAARSSIVEAGRTAGPPLNRRKFNAALMGSSTLPAIIAESEIRGPITGLRQHLADAGCKIEILEASASRSPGKNLTKIKDKFLALEPMERYMAVGVSASGVIAFSLLVALILSSKEPLPASIPIAKSKIAIKTSSAAQANGQNTNREGFAKKTPFLDFHDDLTPLGVTCDQDVKSLSCLLNKIRTLTKTASLALSKPESEQASNDEYIKVLHHRFFICLAEQQTRPEEGDKALVQATLSNLSRPLVYRYGRKSCDASRSSMYECVKQARSQECSKLTAQIEGAIVEFLNREKVLPWTARFADYYANKILNCMSDEQRRSIKPLERARLHLFRYELARAAGKVENTCQEDEYISCTQGLFNGDCQSLRKILHSDAPRLVREITDSCDVLKECR